MRGTLSWVLVLCTIAGTRACGKGSTTTTIPPVVEPEITAVTASGPSEAGRPSTLSKTQLQTLTEALYNADTGLESISINPQGRTSSAALNDAASGHLFNNIPASATSKETVSLMGRLLDNYIADTSGRESYSIEEKQEEAMFLDALMKTQVMKKLETELKSKGLLSGSLRTLLQRIWFTQYRRGSRSINSSGFEHVFVGEVRGKKVGGLHNWLNFVKEEEEGDLDYKGYMKRVSLNGKGEIIKVRFMWNGYPKQVGSVFVGTTPELEIALYTLCFLTYPGASCPAKLAGKTIKIQTWSSKGYIGSAYPDI